MRQTEYILYALLLLNLNENNPHSKLHRSIIFMGNGFYISFILYMVYSFCEALVKTFLKLKISLWMDIYT